VSAKPVEALEIVQADLEYARSFYESWKPGGGEEILRKYFEAVEWMEWNPDLFPTKFGMIQRVILKRISCKKKRDRSFWQCWMVGATRASSAN
jgi:hypothetical protein